MALSVDTGPFLEATAGNLRTNLTAATRETDAFNGDSGTARARSGGIPDEVLLRLKFTRVICHSNGKLNEMEKMIMRYQISQHTL